MWHFITAPRTQYFTNKNWIFSLIQSSVCYIDNCYHTYPTMRKGLFTLHVNVKFGVNLYLKTNNEFQTKHTAWFHITQIYSYTFFQY